MNPWPELSSSQLDSLVTKEFHYFEFTNNMTSGLSSVGGLGFERGRNWVGENLEIQ